MRYVDHDFMSQVSLKDLMGYVDRKVNNGDEI